MVEAESRGRMAETREKCVTRSHRVLETEARLLGPLGREPLREPFPEQTHDVTCLFKGPQSSCREKVEARGPDWTLLQ